MHRSELTIDLGAIRRNARTLLRALDGAELWAVVKADGYGHGTVDVAGAALDAGAQALCVATIGEALRLREEFRVRADPRLRAGAGPRGRAGARGPARALPLDAPRSRRASAST